MSRPAFPGLVLVISLVAGAACSDSTGPDGDGPDPAVIAGLIAAPGAPGVSGSSPCPAGGEMVHDFDVDLATDGDILTVTMDVTMEFRGCAHAIQGRTFTIDGNSQMDGQQKFLIPEIGNRQELIEATGHQVGSHRIRGDGYDRTCSFDLRTTRIPAQGIHELAGTMCGRPVRINLPDFTQ